jgi:hypothetical protein
LGFHADFSDFSRQNLEWLLTVEAGQADNNTSRLLGAGHSHGRTLTSFDNSSALQPVNLSRC